MVSWRPLWLLSAPPLAFGAASRFARHREVAAGIARSGIPRAKVPPTVFGEHSGQALAMLCMALVCVHLAFRSPSPS
jgi:hypothetical protein